MPNVFATEAQKNITAQKVVLFEIDIGRTNTAWTPYAAGVWNVNFLNEYPGDDAFPDIEDAPSVATVGSVTCDGIQLSKVLSPQTCIETDSSFYFESGTRMLYVHAPFGNDPDIFKISIGQVYGFRKGGACAYYGGIDFQDRLVEAPNISASKDPIFYGVFTVDTVNAKIINSDGQYDLLTRDQYVFGNRGRLLIGFDCWDLTEFQQIFEGMIGKIETDEKFLNVEVRDLRSSLSKAIPSNIFTTEEYPNLNPDNVGKPKPRIFGTVKNVPVYVYDEEKTTGAAGSTVTYHAKIGDTEYTSAINSIDAIYVNGTLTTSTNEGLGIREFTLIHTTDTNDQYSPGDEVTCDLTGEVTDTGGVIENGAAVIRRLLYDYYGFTFANDFYNLSKWDELTAKDIGLWMGKQDPIIDWIELICSEGIQADFFVAGDGRYCLRIWNANKASVQTIKRNQILNTPSISDDPTKLISSALIGYAKDWANDEYRLYLNDENESDVFGKYPIYNQKRFDTLMVGSTDAYDYSDKVFEKSIDVETIIKAQIPGWLCVERDLGDIVTIYVNRKASDWYKRCKCEVIGLDKNFNNQTVGLTLRLIQRLDDIPYTQSFYYVDNEDVGYLNYYCSSTNEARKYYGMTINES